MRDRQATTEKETYGGSPMDMPCNTVGHNLVLTVADLRTCIVSEKPRENVSLKMQISDQYYWFCSFHRSVSLQRTQCVVNPGRRDNSMPSVQLLNPQHGLKGFSFSG